MTGTEQQLIDRIYEAAAIPELWPQLLTDLCSLIGAAGGALLSVGSGGSIGSLTTLACREAYQKYLAEGTQLENRRVQRVIASRPNEFAIDLDVCTEEELAQDAIYDRFMRPFGLGWSAGSAFSTPTGDVLVIDFLRRQDSGPFDREAFFRLNPTWAHFARAALLAHRLGLRASRAATDALEIVGLPAAVVDQTGRVLSSNALLELLSPRVRIGAFNRLGFSPVPSNRLLSRAISAMMHGALAEMSIPIAASEGLPALVAHLMPVRGSGADVFSRAAAILVVTTVSIPSAPPTQLLTGLFDLSAAEVHVARGVATGSSVEEIAATRRVSRETIRTQLKSIFAKTGTSRQAELALLLSGLGPVMSRE